MDYDPEFSKKSNTELNTQKNMNFIREHYQNCPGEKNQQKIGSLRHGIVTRFAACRRAGEDNRLRPIQTI